MLRGLRKSFRDAFRGVAHVFRTQRNMRIHGVAALLVAVAGLLLGLGPLEWAILVLTICLVLAAEMLNTALEKLSDYVCPGHHQAIGIAKDVAAGAVLLSAASAVLVGVLVLGNRLLSLLGR